MNNCDITQKHMYNSKNPPVSSAAEKYESMSDETLLLRLKKVI